jgi:DNA polymerase IV
MRNSSGVVFISSSTAARVILHVDMDAFFAAIEQLRRPELRGRPVVVGGDGDPRKRGVVSTASYEARAYGVHSAMPLRSAVRACPHAVFLPVDFAAYREVSDRLRRLLREYSSLVETVSLDEAFVDISHRHDEPVRLAEEIKDRIRAELGLTASIGVAPNKLLAKIASNLVKPDGLTVISAPEVEERLQNLPATALWGIGPKTATRLRDAAGVETVGDLRRLSPDTLRKICGRRYGEYLYQVCRGIDDSPVISEWEPKSYSRETTFQVDVRERNALILAIRQLCERVWDECVREKGHSVRTVTVKIRLNNFQTGTRARTLPTPTTDRSLLLETAVSLLDRFTLDRPVRLVGVRFSSLLRGGRSAPELGAVDSLFGP